MANATHAAHGWDWRHGVHLPQGSTILLVTLTALMLLAAAWAVSQFGVARRLLARLIPARAVPTEAATTSAPAPAPPIVEARKGSVVIIVDEPIVIRGRPKRPAPAHAP